MQFLKTILLALSATTTFAAVIDTSKLQPAAPVTGVAGIRGSNGIVDSRVTTGITQKGPKQGGGRESSSRASNLFYKLRCEAPKTATVGQKEVDFCMANMRCNHGRKIELNSERIPQNQRLAKLQECEDLCECIRRI
ncbi:hypothetical protein BU24DRAFT_474135 [Aaosphaeria arxii CBS 175.79]|uniref:Uncharacterized protein n=1 Tax=Aaosphaeria arxii CBS 175.79 TaxID=1450172 RepID=A0A6A5X8G2_9PLEO|nr:uncharacterized protein BU24DRAFT_474135 [Aaosphaeria arxii CBS 175.79]KAF2009206.1 hypothetical protein BU24DRAFT_474135 [Aaosphaeria arxii CBS 175.79]